MRAEKPTNEEARLAALRRYNILDSPREMGFDELTRHVAFVCETPIALISLVDAGRQWFKSEVGLDGVRETSLEHSFCAHNIVEPGLMIVPDVRLDGRFADDTLARSMGLRFYAGCTLETPDGYPIGTICVLDHRPRELTDEQKFALQTMAHQVMIQLELRRVLAEQQDLVQQLHQKQALQQDREFIAAVLDSAGDGIVACDKDGVLRLFNRAARDLHGLPEEPLPAEEWAEHYDLYLPDGKTRMGKEQVPLFRALQEGHVRGAEMVVAPKGHPRCHLLATGRAFFDTKGEKAGAVVVMHDITARIRAEEDRFRAVQARAAEEAAEEARQKTARILESITDAFVLVDQQWRFTYLNRHAEQLLRRDRRELIGRTVWDEFPEVVGSQFEEGYRKAVRDQVTVKFESFYPPLDRWFQVTAYPSAEGLSIYFSDSSERKRAEQALQEKERRFRAVFDQQFQFMVLLSPNGVVLEINNLPLQVGGFTREQVIGRPLWETPFWAHLPDMRQLWQHKIAEAAATGQRVTSEVLFETSTGQIRIADAAVTPAKGDAGEIMFFIGEGKDITERKQAEKRLRESEEHFRMLVHQVKDFAIFMTDPEGRPTSYNEGVERILRYTEEEFFGSPPHMLYTPEDIEARIPEKELAEATQKGVASDDRWLVRKGGERFWASGMTTAVRDGSGKLVGFAKVFRDLTEQKKIEDELRAARNQLQHYADDLERRVAERTERLRETISELEAFSYSVSHDLRAPLRAMQGYSQFLLLDYGDKLDENGRDFIVRIRDAARRLDQLVQDILTYSRVARAQIQLKPLDLEPLIHEVIQGYPALQPGKAEIEIKSPLLKVLAHEPSMMQCISNLLGNAVKFVPENRRPRVVISTERRNGKVRVWFEDNGIGIAPESQQRIFRMFETVHLQPRYEGTGIGLAIVRKAVERMRGDVGVESELGAGSKFWIDLEEAK